MSDKETDYVHIAVRGPLYMRRWLLRRAKYELTDLSSLVRRILRDYMGRVDKEAYKKMQSMISEETKDGEQNASTE